jgi:hypothetical protein
MLRASVLLSALSTLFACSSKPLPERLPHECTYFGDEFRYGVGAPEPLVDAGGLDVVLAEPCLPPGLFSFDDGGGVACLMLVTLPEPGDESVCTASGFDVPGSDILAELRAAGLLRFPTCAVPQLRGSALGDGGSCADSPEAGWCFVTGVACATIETSRATMRPGATLTFQCSQGC